MTIDEALTSLAKSSPVSTASYLGLTLAVGNWSRMGHSMMSSSKDCRTTPILPACLLDDLSVQTFHGAAPLPFALFVINSVMKSSNAWAEGFVCLDYCAVCFEVWAKLAD